MFEKKIFTKLNENDKEVRTCLKKKFSLKRIWIRQETDLKIPKALINRVFNNGYSKHFRDMTLGTKLKKMIKEHVWIPKALINRVFKTVTASISEIWPRGQIWKNFDKRTCLKKKFLLKRIWMRQETDLKIPKALINRVFNNGYSKHFRDMTSGTKLKKMIKEHVWKKNFYSNAFE